MARFGTLPAERAISLLFNDFLKADAWAVSLYEDVAGSAGEMWGQNTAALEFRMERLRESWRNRKDVSDGAVRSQEVLTTGCERSGKRAKAFFDAATPLDPLRVCLITVVWEDDGCLDLANELGPKVRDALKDFYTLQLRAQEAERLGSAMRKTLDCLSAACVIADREGKVAYANHASQGLLEGLDESGNCDRKDRGRSLRDLIDKTSFADRPGNGSNGAQCISMHSLDARSGPSRTAYVMRLEATEQQRPEPELLFGIFVPKGEGLPDAETLAKGLGLSRSESRVAALIIRGKSIQQTANELSLSEQTARTYLKRIFAKVGVSRQTQLAAAAANMHLPLSDGSQFREVNGNAPAVSVRAVPCARKRLRNTAKPPAIEITGGEV